MRCTPWNLWFDGFHNNHPQRELQATVGHLGTSCFDGLTTAQNREIAQRDYWDYGASIATGERLPNW